MTCVPCLAAKLDTVVSHTSLSLEIMELFSVSSVKQGSSPKAGENHCIAEIELNIHHKRAEDLGESDIGHPMGRRNTLDFPGQYIHCTEITIEHPLRGKKQKIWENQY